MRLSTSEIIKIKTAIDKFASSYSLYLHGSRINDNLKGGDIDLFLIIPDDQFNHLVSKKHYLESEISLALCDQRIDLLLISKSEKEGNSFFADSDKIEL